MNIALLASVSLFALVVTGRPISSSDAELGDLAHTSSTFQTSVQAAFQVLPGNDDLTSSAACFHSQRIQCLPELDVLVETTTQGRDMVDSEGERDEDSPLFLEPVVEQKSSTDQSPRPSTPLAVLAVSCVAAFLLLACVALTLYVVELFRSQILHTWELLPNLWRFPTPKENATAIATRISTDRLLAAEEESTGVYGLPTAVLDTESELDDIDEKYQDALDMTPLPLVHDLPLEDDLCHPSHFSDAPLVTFFHSLDQSVADRSIPLRELSSPDTRPAWSVRAIDSPLLGRSSRQADVDATPQPLIPPARRAYRSPVPELDIALAMQLRPGLGIAADSAWMVRFLMTIFGWLAVALAGNAR